LPSMDVILGGLMQQGFIELGAAPVVAATAKAAPAASVAYKTSAPGTPSIAKGALELDSIKVGMVRDVSLLLGSDAEPVIKKIQNCMTRDDLFAAMMGIKKIVTLYVDKPTGDRFAAKYEILSS
jgi:hypothetical protein